MEYNKNDWCKECRYHKRFCKCKEDKMDMKVKWFTVVIIFFFILVGIASADSHSQYLEIAKEFQGNPVIIQMKPPVIMIMIFAKDVKKGDKPIACEVRDMRTQKPLRIYKVIDGKSALVWECDCMKGGGDAPKHSCQRDLRQPQVA